MFFKMSVNFNHNESIFILIVEKKATCLLAKSLFVGLAKQVIFKYSRGLGCRNPAPQYPKPCMLKSHIESHSIGRHVLHPL